MMHLRRFLAAAIVLPAMASAALAADSSSINEPPVFTWTGFYGGEAAGYSWMDGSAKRTAPDGLFSMAFDAASSAFTVANGASAKQPHGIIGGGQIGFNYQIQSFVFGVEGDLSYTGLDAATNPAGLGTSCCAESLAFTSDVNSHWLSTMRGRFGTAIDRLLVYATGGLAVAQRNYNSGYAILSPDGPDFSIGSASRTAAGLAVGGGLEYALSKNWTLKGEYLYADLGPGRSFASNSSAIPVNPSYHQGDLDEAVVRAAINYKFDWLAAPGSASAR